jgi:SNF2 family DNA or RNA helicase
MTWVSAKRFKRSVFLIERGNQGPALVVAPTSVGDNWMRETERFCANA